MAQFFIGTESGAEEVISFDATVRENHQDGAIAAQYPVEREVSGTDHVQPVPGFLTLDVAVSNVPLQAPPGGFPDGVTLSQQRVRNDDGSTAEVLTASGEISRVESVYERLLELMRDGTQLRVVTSRRDYGRMVLVRVDAPVDAFSGDGQDLRIDMQQILTGRAESRQVTVRTASARGKPPADAGSQGKTEVPGETIGAQRDILSNIGSAF